jgi:hypothetical protein
MNRLALTWIALAALAAGSARAEETPNHPLLNDQFRVSLGGFYSESATSARLSNSNGGGGVDVNFEDALGLEERKWGDNTFAVGTQVSSNLTISDLRTAIGYSFFRRTDKELGIAAGVHTLGYKASIDGGTFGARTESVTAPLPVLSLYGQFALTDTWALSVRSDWLSLEYDKYSGSIRAARIDVVYQPFKHVAFGLGMHALTLKLDVQNERSKFQARSTFQGPAAFMSVSF